MCTGAYAYIHIYMHIIWRDNFRRDPKTLLQAALAAGFPAVAPGTVLPRQPSLHPWPARPRGLAWVLPSSYRPSKRRNMAGGLLKEGMGLF